MKKAFKQMLVTAVTAVLASTAVIGLAACSENENQSSLEYAYKSLLNGGFETADLSGWTVEEGEAYNADNVSSRRTVAGADGSEVPVNHAGNWYLDGKGFDRARSNGYTGSIRSNRFLLTGTGEVSLRLAGGALYTEENGNKTPKSKESTCYVGVYTARDDKMVAKFSNTRFTADSDRADVFSEYRKDLSAYLNEELYLKIVDNDTSAYYGYLSVDDICVGGQQSQTAGEYFIKSRNFIADIEAPSIYEVKNGGFETGSLAGWQVTEGEAFSHNGVNANAYWWNENISYCRDGSYHYGHFMPSATGRMRSSEFVVGGSGYVSYKLGGCKDNNLTYLRFMLKGEAGEDEEVARLSNFKYWDYEFPYVQNGMCRLNMVQYYVNLSMFKGKTMYIEVVDENTSSDELGCITLDSVQTYWESKPIWHTSLAFEAKLSVSETE